MTIDIYARAAAEADRARELYPTPDYLLSAFVEECGEVVKAINDLREGKPGVTLWNVRQELIQAVAMGIRLYSEGDPVNRLQPPCEAREPA